MSASPISTTLARNRALPAPPASLSALLEPTGIRINGPHSWDIQVHQPRFYRRILTGWSMALGESYMDGDWDCEQIDEFFARLMRHDLDGQPLGWSRVRLALAFAAAAWSNPQREERAFVVGERHYDLGNDLYESMLDERMVYSCAYWGAGAKTLDEAQQHKLDMICRKLELRPGMTLLDIGCGWGGLARHAAEHYGVRVTGITVSKAQQALARRVCEGLPVDIQLVDYRQLAKDMQAASRRPFDRIASVGMFEHVGPKNYRAYFDAARDLLAPDGLFLLHTIGIDRPATHTDPWIDKYIFPGGKLPAASELAAATERRFVIEDWHNFGPDYDRTLMQWHQRFEAAWPSLAPRYGERFRRMWRYYLLSCAGFFRARQGQLWQLVLAPRHRASAYRSFRPLTV
jgi:cyclopropane-fatty-acyl-phospholipid synthase